METRGRIIMKTLILTILAIVLYRVIEYVDGEKGLKIIPYSTAQRVKMSILQGFNKENDHTSEVLR